MTNKTSSTPIEFTLILLFLIEKFGVGNIFFYFDFFLFKKIMSYLLPSCGVIRNHQYDSLSLFPFE